MRGGWELFFYGLAGAALAILMGLAILGLLDTPSP